MADDKENQWVLEKYYYEKRPYIKYENFPQLGGLFSRPLATLPVPFPGRPWVTRHEGAVGLLIGRAVKIRIPWGLIQIVNRTT